MKPPSQNLAPVPEDPEGRFAGGRPWDLHPIEGGPAEDESSLIQRLRSRVVRLAPKPIVRVLARPYVAGETRAEALALVARLWREKRLHSTVDVLGEAIEETAQVRTMMGEYMAALDELGACPHANVSIKLSALGQGLDDRLCEENLERLLTKAASYGQFVRFDMEDASTVDSTLDFYRRFVSRFPRIGVVLQSRLFRTPEDIRRLAGLRPNVRLCIGIYRESPKIALQDKRSMKVHLLEQLEMMWENGQYVALATHDERVIRQALSMAERKGIGPDRYEVQMLLGVPRAALQSELQRMGLKVRLYVPYGEQWYKYCLRRLEHNPEMASLVLRNLFSRG